MQQVTPPAAGAARLGLDVLAAVATGRLPPAAGPLKATPTAFVDGQAGSSGTAGRVGADVAALSGKLLKVQAKKDKRKKKADGKVHLLVTLQYSLATAHGGRGVNCAGRGHGAGWPSSQPAAGRLSHAAHSGLFIYSVYDLTVTGCAARSAVAFRSVVVVKILPAF